MFVGICESGDEGEIRVKQEAFLAGKHSSRKWDKRKDDRKGDTQNEVGGLEKRTNPRNKQGHITCVTCRSIFPYAKNCPDSKSAGFSKRVSSHKSASSSAEEALEAQRETEEESESIVIFAMFSGLREPDIG